MADTDFVCLQLEGGGYSPVLCKKCGEMGTLLELQEPGPVPRGYVGCKCGVFVGLNAPDTVRAWGEWQKSPKDRASLPKGSWPDPEECVEAIKELYSYFLGGDGYELTSPKTLVKGILQSFSELQDIAMGDH